MRKKHIFIYIIIITIFQLHAACVCHAGEIDEFDVYDLIKTENDTEFEQNIKNIPSQYNWMNPASIRYIRTQYLAELNIIKSKYSSCFSTNYGDSLTDVFDEIGDSRVTYFYGICNSIDTGKSGCDVLEDNFPEQYRDCQKNDFDFWTVMLPLTVEQNNNMVTFQNFSEKYCDVKINNVSDVPENTGSKCKNDLFSLLMTLRIILVDKNPGDCSAIPVSEFRSYCLDTLEKNKEICSNSMNQDLFLCKDNSLNNAIQALVHNDKTKLFTGDNLSIHDLFAAHFMDKNACKTYFDDVLISRCKEQMETEIQQIRVRFP